MSKKYLISPSIISADLTSLGDQLSVLEDSGADWIHIDVMDHQFVPNLTVGPLIVEACRRGTTLPLDVHLMVESPEKMVDDIANAGADSITAHVEATTHLHRTLSLIRQTGCHAGVTLNPGTPVVSIQNVLHLVDLVLVMSVNPGFSGQSFIPEVLPKVSKIRSLLDNINPEAKVQIDGGISPQTLPEALKAGAQVFVSGSSIFNHPKGISAGIKALREKIIEMQEEM